MIKAIEHIKRMRGGSQAHLMRCSDGGLYVVKFQNNPQGIRILANEMLGSALASYLGLRVPHFEIVSISEDLIRDSLELRMQFGHGRVPCQAGLNFGSRYPGQYKSVPVYDYLPESELSAVSNLQDFLGILAFDKWTCNTDGRQAVFVYESDQQVFGAYMVDNGFCFNAGEWNFPDAPLRGLYNKRAVYQNVRGIDAFDFWIAGIERITLNVLEDAYSAIPKEWYEHDVEAIHKLIDRLSRRRDRVPDLITSARKTSPNPFPSWK